MRSCSSCGCNYQDNIAFCPKCGVKLEEKNKSHFCPFCGKNLDNVALGKFCPFCGGRLDSSLLSTESTASLEYNTDSNLNTDEVAADTKEKSSNETKLKSLWSYIKNALMFFVLILVWGAAKGGGRIFSRGTPIEKGYLIGVLIAGIIGGVVPAFVAYKYCSFDEPSVVVTLIFIAHIIVGYWRGIFYSVPIGFIVAILLYYFFNKDK